MPVSRQPAEIITGERAASLPPCATPTPYSPGHVRRDHPRCRRPRAPCHAGGDARDARGAARAVVAGGEGPPPRTCRRDHAPRGPAPPGGRRGARRDRGDPRRAARRAGDRAEAPLLSLSTCLLYTSDAADEEDSVDLGGRRIIKKK